MSWLFSQALVEAFSVDTCSDGGPCAQLNVMPTPHKFWRNDKTMEFSDLSRFGLTCAALTESRGAELLTWFRAGSRAKTSAAPARVKASTVHEVAYGNTWPASLAMYDLDSFTWRTAQFSLLGDLEPYSETWPRSGTTRNGMSFQRLTLAPATSESASGLWQTPVADDAVEREAGKWNSRGEPKLSAEVKLWPTATARDWRSGKASQATHDRNSRQLSEQVGGLLNPEWVEWLMGWPIGWTDSKPLATAKYQEWQQQHSPRSQPSLTPAEAVAEGSE